MRQTTSPTLSKVTNLARPEILALKAYESARSLVSSQSASVYLDANESPYGEFNRYPEPQPKELVERLCGLCGVTADQMVIGRGSDEAIDLLVRTFCRPGQDSILICPPTYGVYEIAAQIQGARITRVPLSFEKQSFKLDEAGIEAAMGEPGANIKIVFLCSPNNPTGTAFDPEALGRICEAALGKAIVVVDEAYAEFSERRSMIGSLSRFANLVVLRTLSKAWALAAARCGVSLASPELTALLHKVRAPYPLSLPAVQAVLAATDRAAQDGLKTRVSLISDSRRKLISRLVELPGVVEIFESSANFILVRFKDSAAVMSASRAAGIILRDRSKEAGLAGCVRITLGSETENQALLEALAKGASS